MFLLMFLTACAAHAQSYIYVANAGEDTLSKIDIDQNKEVARYRTWFGPGSPHHFTRDPAKVDMARSGPAPSRVVVDSSGNVYVLNRFFSSHRPVLLKILPSGGTNTSTGPNPLDMIDAGSAPNDTIDKAKYDLTDTTEVKDQRIAWAIEVGVDSDKGRQGRSLCLDLSGNIWVGIHLTNKYYRFTPDGVQIGQPIDTGQHNPYGCVVDSEGILFSASNGNHAAMIDTKAPTPTATVLDHSKLGLDYGISLMNRCGMESEVFFSHRGNLPGGVGGNTYFTYSKSKGFLASNLPASQSFGSYAIAIDLDGNILAGDSQGRVVKWNGLTKALIWDTNAKNSTVATKDMHGLIVDAHNDVWAVHLLAPSDQSKPGKVVKYDGATGDYMAEVTVGLAPYTYSNPPPPNCPCARIDPTRIECQGMNGGVGTYSWSFTFTNLSPFPAAANLLDVTSPDPDVTILSPKPSTSIPLTPAVPVQGQKTVSGTFEVKNAEPGERVCLNMRLMGGENRGTWCCPEQQVCFTLPECRECADVKSEWKCDILTGKPYLELTITNNGPSDAQSVQIFSTTPGVTVSPLTTTKPLPVGKPVSVNLDVTGVSAGQTINLTVNIHGPTDPKTGVYSWCCTSSERVVHPTQKICNVVHDPTKEDPKHN
ncbi:MAG TPA: hypothetical protein VEK79_04895 [Thermoanaerobaculia bacterium]|nr:hypothetical protein [Thermoanaerobaculia bacterium]